MAEDTGARQDFSTAADGIPVATYAWLPAGAPRALVQIAVQHPKLREHVVALLSDLLREAEHYHEIVNTAAMDALVELIQHIKLAALSGRQCLRTR